MAKTMTKGQIEHLAVRIDCEIKKAVDNFEAKLPKVASCLTLKQKLKAIRAGAATLKKDVEDCSYQRLFDSFTYPGEVDADVQRQQNKEAIEKFKKPLLVKRQAIMDNAILGGADEALAALQDFVAQLNR